MEVVAGGMIGASGSKWQLTLRYDGTHYYLVSMLQLYWGRQIVRVRHFVHSAEDPIVPGHSAHWLTYFLSLREQQCNPFKSLPGWHTAVTLSASHVTRGRAYYRATVDTDMYASVASSSTRLEIAPPRLTPHFTNRVSRPGSTRCNQQCTHKQSTSLWK